MKSLSYTLKICLGVLLFTVSALSAFSFPEPSSKIAGKDRALITDYVAGDTTYATICFNQLPYQWNGITCLTAGLYSVTLTGANGQDSVVYLQLTVINIGTGITNAIVCNNDLPYIWNGNSYAASGTYSVTLTSSSGCDSVAILSLTVNDVVTSTTTVSVCSNQLPYSWNGNNYTTTGIYTAILTSAAGCDSIATLRFTVRPVSAGYTTASICANQLPYYWNGQPYNAAGNYSIILPAANGCDSTAHLNLVVNPLLSSTTRDTVCNTQLPYHWNGNTYTAAGTYSVTLHSVAGCDSVARLILTVPVVNISTTYITVCTAQLPFQWNGNSYPAAGLYLATLTGSSGCDSIARLRLTVASLYTSVTNITICNSQLPYVWNGNNYFSTGTYTASFVTQAGCDSVATLNLRVNTPRTGPDTVIICQEQLPFTWNGNVYTAAGVYPFSPPIVTGPCNRVDTLVLLIRTIVPSNSIIRVCSNRLPYNWNGNTYSSPGQYSVTLNSSTGCDSTANLNLLVVQVTTSTTNRSVCSNQLPFIWNGQPFTASGSYTLTLPGQNACDSLATLNLVVNPVDTSITEMSICTNQLPFIWNGHAYNSTGNYPVLLTASTGCDSIALLRLTVHPFLTSTTTVNVCNSQLPYLWNGNSYSAGGFYPVTLTSSGGCDSIANLNLVVNSHISSTSNIAVCSNQLPYLWNGNSYSTAGIYRDTLISTGGCDSIAILNLTINPVPTSTTYASVCNNQLPYAWNGNAYPFGGTFVVTLTASSGCDSLATLVLEASDILTSTTYVTICTGQVPYLWNGNSYTTAGTYSAIMTTPGGCDSVPVLSLAIVPYVTDTTDVTICASALPYQWNGNTYNATGLYDVMLNTSSGCDSLLSLNLTVNPVDTTIVTAAVCANQLPFVWNGNNYTATGQYDILFTASNGCDSIARLVLQVNPVEHTIVDRSICTNQLPFTWNGQTYLSAGTYSVTLTSSAGCDSLVTLNLTVGSVVTSTNDVSVCSSQLPYNWNNQDYNISGTYSLTLVGSSGCDSIATLNLTVNAIATSTTDVTICDNQLPYNWNNQTYNVGGIYNVLLISAAGCDSVATLNLLVNPVVASTTDIAVCSNQLPYNWNNQSYSAAGSYAVVLISAAGCDSIANLNLVVNAVQSSTSDFNICTNQVPYNWNGQTYNAPGTYTVLLTTVAGCDSMATLNLSVSSVVTSTTNVSVCTSQLPYNWNNQDYNVGGTYTVSLIGSSGCDSIATLNLTVNAPVTSTTDISICSSQLPYSWNNQGYNAAGSYSVVLTSAAGCDSVANLNLQVNPVLTSTTDIAVCSGVLPYNWNGQTYNASGTYTVTLTSAAGCDSIATLNLLVHEVQTSTTDITICNNQLPYNWNGQTYNVPGTYSVVLTSAAGCDSIATLQLSASSVVTSTSSVAICINQLPYSWNSQVYNSAGTYAVTLTGSSGCDSVATLVLTVNNILSSTVTVNVCSNQLPYTWNGNSYNSSGLYSVTLTSAAGCDSIANLQLTVSNTISTVFTDTVCSNLLPYLWNGNQYNASGSYIATFVSASGCDSTVTLQLTVANTISHTVTVNICNNQLPYMWNGLIIPGTGSYTQTFNATNGCDSVVTLNLFALQETASTTAVTVCANQLPYQWNGQQYSSSGLYAVVLTNQAGCDSTASLQLTVLPVANGDSYVTVCNNQLPYTWNGNSYTVSGDYQVTLTGSNGCDSLANLHLTVNIVTSSTETISICSNQLPYSWNAQQITQAGTYTAHFTGAAGCDSVVTLQLLVNPVVTSSSTASICSSQLPYIWNGMSLNSSGDHTITLVSSAGCDSLVTLHLTVHPTPGLPSVVSPVVYCQYDPSVPLAATGSNTLLWYQQASGGIGSTTAPVPSTQLPGTSYYYVADATSFCEGPRVRITVTVNGKPALGADRDIRVCYGGHINLDSIYSTNGLNAAWMMNQQPVANTDSIYQNGVYTLTVSNASGCMDTAVVTFTVQPQVIADAGPDGTAEYNYPYQLSGSGGGTYQWFPGFPLLNNSGIANPVATLAEDTRFILMVKDEIGCRASDTVFVRVLRGPTFYIPNAFTPNGDGLNDVFRPTPVGIDRLEYFRIFNRFGEKVFETSETNKGWDGNYKGIRQPLGGYVWMLKGVDRKGEVKVMKGNVLLVR